MIFPVVLHRRLDGANARNWPGLVLLDPDARLPAAVLAQEAWEAMHKANPVNLLRTRLSATARREMEVMGHECEVQAACLIYDRDPAEYRVAEADRMKRGYDGLFAAVTRAQLRAAMEARSDEARRWVRQHRDRLEEWS
ncbi:hypothetical protein [Paracoccus spongiarum]|uniref:Uncharacterized protein n=1 Tax=Paracoccus spongiarum TaxID=3064387 RepID=A0ABT9JDM9_9RHOB|nr:hypothetical protein [Paracoccus sp. 2205BS29-5]MDP5307923.1 hypothetical protein [Paracoccus sp. 2205BS29-5]